MHKPPPHHPLLKTPTQRPQPRPNTRPTRRPLLQGLILVLLLLACGPACQGPPEVRETLRELRVLAIRAVPPEARPGDKVKLSVLAFAPKNQTLQVTWHLCTSPEQADQGCHQTSPNIGDKDTIELTVPDNYLANPTPLESFRGRYLPVTLVVRAGDKELIATKRITVSTNPSNKNPELTGLTLTPEGGAPLTEPYKAQFQKRVLLQPTLQDGAQQTFTLIDPQGNKQEKTPETLYFSWYVTEGTMQKGYLTQENPQDKNARNNTWIAPEKADLSDTVTLYLIARDSRGGVHWLSRTILLSP